MKIERKLWDWTDIEAATARMLISLTRAPSAKKIERCVKQRKCPYHVDSSLAGAAVMSESNCVICNCRLTSGCGSPDYVCLECSKKHGLCKVCGSRISQ